eukprot:TRINITY_DN690_c0_g1_i4.p1 TRINITY_DN690_c0_g1~~TRINITY_DN690_c0_g1_i4.p1  ORF type:complete len:110 (-),score=15.83 TRINITY_DN690_c0_g1_i4:29-358(-)
MSSQRAASRADRPCLLRIGHRALPLHHGKPALFVAGAAGPAFEGSGITRNPSKIPVCSENVTSTVEICWLSPGPFRHHLTKLSIALLFPSTMISVLSGYSCSAPDSRRM